MYRVLATANAFSRAGWEVTVLTATRETFARLTGSDPDAERHIDSRINVVRIPFDSRRGEANLRKWSRFRLLSPLLWNYLHLTRSRITFPESSYGNWKAPLIRASEEIHRRHPVDLVVGSANPNVDFVPGLHLHRAYAVPYVMDYRDAWHLSVYSGKRVGSPKRRSNRLERRLLGNAKEAWFVNQAIRDWHAVEYPSGAERFHVVANGFDPEFLRSFAVSTPDPASGLTFGYLGTISGPLPLRETLDGWRIARSESLVVSRSRLVFRGRIGQGAEADARTVALLEEYRDDNVVHQGPVSKTKVAEVYQEFDALLLVLARGKYVTSGKVFEYAATGLPIAALFHPETAATHVLKGHPRVSSVADTTPRLIADALIATAEEALATTPESIDQARTWAAHLARDAQLSPRISALYDDLNPRREAAK